MARTAASAKNTQAAQPTLQQRKQELVRDTIWEAATELFAEKGYDQTTVEDIAERAGVSRRSFFRYYSSKGDVLASGLSTYGDIIAAAVAGCPGNANLRAIFKQVVTEVAGQCAAQPGTRRVIEILIKNPAASEAQHSRSAELQQRVKAAYAERKKALGGTDAAVLAPMTLATLQVVFQIWFERGEKDITATVRRVLAAMDAVI